MDTIFLGINEILTMQVVLAIVFGAILGVSIGSIHGLEPAGVMAILLPMTFNFDPLPAVTLLLGVYGGAWYGGAIPAILMNTPGTPVAVLTTYDGYPMTQKARVSVRCQLRTRRLSSVAWSVCCLWFFGASSITNRDALWLGRVCDVGCAE